MSFTGNKGPSYEVTGDRADLPSFWPFDPAKTKQEKRDTLERWEEGLTMKVNLTTVVSCCKLSSSDHLHNYVKVVKRPW